MPHHTSFPFPTNFLSACYSLRLKVSISNNPKAFCQRDLLEEPVYGLGQIQDPKVNPYQMTTRELKLTACLHVTYTLYYKCSQETRSNE